VTRLDELLEPYRIRDFPDSAVDWKKVQADIREAYRIGHDDGRNARIPQGDETFIARLRRQQEESSGQES